MMLENRVKYEQTYLPRRLREMRRRRAGEGGVDSRVRSNTFSDSLETRHASPPA